MENTRAQRGGEYGKNGEFYGGGQFLPNTELSKMNKSKFNATQKKYEIEPYVFEVAPEGKRSIYKIFAGVFGKVVNGKMEITCSEQTFKYMGMSREQAQEMADKWNAGERWI